MKIMHFFGMAAVLAFCVVCQAADGIDHNLNEFPMLAGEKDDAPRIQRAIEATPDGVLTIPRGTYQIATPIMVTNDCSLEMNKNAILKAIAPMETVISIVRKKGWRHDHALFTHGGVIDGNGMASCLLIRNFWHYTICDSVLLNGKEYGLRVDGGCEIMCNNVYARCVMPGLAGNTGFLINGGDSHYTDCVVVDYTIGFDNFPGVGANRLTRCHVWGGAIPPKAPGEPPEMLKDSVSFRISGCGTILRDCYADTSAIGFEINIGEIRLLGCSYVNNPRFKLDNITVIKHTQGRLLVTDGMITKSAPHFKVYEGCGSVEWHNMIYSCFEPTEYCPGASTFDKK